MTTPTSVFPVSERPTIFPFLRRSGFWHCFISTWNRKTKLIRVFGKSVETLINEQLITLTTAIEFLDFVYVKWRKIVSLAYSVLLTLRKGIVPGSVDSEGAPLGVSLVLGEGYRRIMHNRGVVVASQNVNLIRRHRCEIWDVGYNKRIEYNYAEVLFWYLCFELTLAYVTRVDSVNSQKLL